MRKKYKTLKLTDEELQTLKISLMKETLNYKVFENSKRYENMLKENPERLEILHKENKIKHKIITILKYLER